MGAIRDLHEGKAPRLPERAQPAAPDGLSHIQRLHGAKPQPPGSDGLFDALAAGARAIIPSLKAGIGGAVEALGEMPVYIPPERQAEVFAEAQRLGNVPLGQAARSLGIERPPESMPVRVAEAGAEVFARNKRELDAIASQFEPYSVPWYAFSFVRAMGEMAPGVALSLAARSPGLGAGQIGAHVAGLQYGESRQERARTPEEARTDALYMGAAELVTERVPLGILIKQGTRLRTRLARAGLTESAQEAVTEALQIGYELGEFGDEMTLGEAVQRITAAAILGAAVGSSMAVIIEPLNRLDRDGPRPPRLPLPGVPPEGGPPERGGPRSVSPETAEGMERLRQRVLDIQRQTPPEPPVPPVDIVQAPPPQREPLLLPPPTPPPAPQVQPPPQAPVPPAVPPVTARVLGPDTPATRAVQEMLEREELERQRPADSPPLRLPRPAEQVPEQRPEAPERPRRPRARPRREPRNALEFIASIGGVRDDEGHNLVSTIGRQFLPGFGPLIRPKGNSVAQLGERLVEARYLPPSQIGSGAATEADVLDLIDAQARSPSARLRPEEALDEDARLQAREQARTEQRVRDEFETRLGETPTDEEVAAVLAIMAETGQSAETAVETFVERQAIEDQDALVEETGDDDYDIPFETTPSATPAEGLEGRQGVPPAAPEGREIEPPPTAPKRTPQISKFALAPDPFYSALIRNVAGLKQKKAPAKQWAGMIKNLPGVKAEEIEWSGVMEWLQGQGSLTRTALLEFLMANRITVEETVLGAEEFEPHLAELDRRVTNDDTGEYEIDVEEPVSGMQFTIVGDPDSGNVWVEAPEGMRVDVPSRVNQQTESDGWIAIDQFLKDRGLLGTGGPAKFEDYTLPGGENYRELLLRLPTTKDPEIEARRIMGPEFDRLGPAEREALITSATNRARADAYTDPHFNEQNVLAHIRFNERTDADGNRVLFIEEIQSDWHQKGRKQGYQSAPAFFPAVPDAPFKTTWEQLSFKRMLRWAAENGFDKLAWTTGAQQVTRYEDALRKHVDRIEWNKTPEGVQIVGYKGSDYLGDVTQQPDGLWEVRGPHNEFWGTYYNRRDAQEAWETKRAREGLRASGGERVVDTTQKEDTLSDAIGKAMADRILQDPNQSGVIEGEDITISDVGMAGFYDRRIVNFARKYGKKWGAKVGITKLSGYPVQQAHAIDITEAMRKSVMAGQPLFQRGLPSDISRTPEAGGMRALRQRLRDAGIDDRISLKFSQEVLTGPRSAYGVYTPSYKTIEIALRMHGERQTWTLDHEIVHALRDLGVINEQEWGALRRNALADKERMDDIRRRYGPRGLSEEALIEEAIADSYSDWQAGRLQAGTLLQRIFTAIRNFFEALGNALRGMGFRSAEDVFEAFASGDVGRRPGREAAAGEDKFALPPVPKGKDLEPKEVGSFMPAPIRAAYTNFARKLQAKIEATAGYGQFFDPLWILGPEFKAFRNRTFGRLYQADRIGKYLEAAYDGLNREQTETAYEFMTTKGASPSMLPATHRHKIVRAKNMMKALGRELERRKFIDKATYEDEYLPQIYLKHMIEEREGGAPFQGKMGERGYAKPRDPWLQKNPYIREVVMGQVKDPAYLTARAFILPMRDLIIHDFLDTIAQNPDWAFMPSLVEVRGHFVSAVWAKREAQRLRKQSDQYEAVGLTKADADEARKYADELEEEADAGLKERIPAEYKQMPDSPAYGPLRGMYVRKQIYDQLVGAFRLFQGDNPLESLLGAGGVGTKATQVWKGFKVSWNLPTVSRNIMSGFAAMHLYGDVDFHMVVPRVFQAIQQMSSGRGRGWAVAKRHGIAATTYSSQELGMIERRMLKDINAKLPHKTILLNLAKDLYRLGPRAYGLVEQMFKTAVIIDQLAKGATPEAAVIHANRAIFDYSNVPPWVQYVRSTPLLGPFLTFQYKQIPRSQQAAVMRPWKYLPYIGMMWAAAAMIRSMYDVDEEDYDKLRKAMQGWLQERAMVMILPFKDAQGRWQPLDFGYMLPFAGLPEAALSAYQRRWLDIPGTLALGGGPMADIIAVLKTGRDPFTDRPLWNPGLPTADNIANLMLYIWRLAAPTWLSDVGAARRIYDAEVGNVDPRTGEPKYTKAQAYLRMIGVNIYPFDPIESQQMNLRQMEWVISKAENELGKIARDRSLNPQERSEMLDRQEAYILDLIDEMDKYHESSTVPRALEAGR